MAAKTEAKMNGAKVANLLIDEKGYADLYRTRTVGTASGKFHSDIRIARIVFQQEDQSRYEFAVYNVDGPEWTHGFIGYIYSTPGGLWGALSVRAHGEEFVGHFETPAAACEAL
jgi:hypothetical protein